MTINNCWKFGLLVLLLLVACSGVKQPQGTATVSPTQTKPAANTPTRLAMGVATQAATQPATAEPSPSPARLTLTKTPAPPLHAAPTEVIPGEWHVPVVSVPSLIGQDQYLPVWDEQNNLLNWAGDGYKLINPLTGRAESTATPAPTLAWGGEKASSTDEFSVICSSDGVKMVRLADQHLLAEAQLAVECYLEANWTSDGSAAALIDRRGAVYVWQPDGSQPVKVGDGMSLAAPIWSPDNTRILFTHRVEGAYVTIAGLSIAYRDGRPAIKTGAQIDADNHWDANTSLIWETNTTIRNRMCGIYFCYYDYYDAVTGRFIIRTYFDESGGRVPSISPDGRWLVLEADQRATNWERRWELQNSSPDSYPGLMIVDLQTLRRGLVIQSNQPGVDGENRGIWSGEDSIKFMGWNADSSRFYLIHFLFGMPVYDLPVGLLALYPNNGYIEPVLPDVAYGLAAPNGNHIFLVTAETIEAQRATKLKAGIYDLDGTPVSALQPAAEEREYAILNQVDVWSTKSTRLIASEWSPDGNWLVYADSSGNIWLMDRAGKIMPLASNLPKASWDGRAVFSWSSDGRYLLIISQAHAWISEIVIP